MEYDIEEAIESLKNPIPSILYHYTTQKGLLEIVDTKTIWATDIFYLNDSLEYEYAAKLIQDVIDEYLVNSQSPPARTVDTSLARKVTPEKLQQLMLESTKKGISSLTRFRIYVCSFTEEGDQLSQWRGYCPKGGFSIGFHFNQLSQIAKKHDSDLLPCVYDFEIQNQILEELLVLYSKRYVEAMNVNNQKNSDELAHIITNEFIISLSALAPMLKHESFKEEKEWRIVSSRLRVMPEIKFRANESTIIPYIEISLCQSEEEIHFKRIFLGPASNSQFSKEAVLQLLKKNRMPEHTIELSRASYRSV